MQHANSSDQLVAQLKNLFSDTPSFDLDDRTAEDKIRQFGFENLGPELLSWWERKCHHILDFPEEVTLISSDSLFSSLLPWYLQALLLFSDVSPNDNHLYSFFVRAEDSSWVTQLDEAQSKVVGKLLLQYVSENADPASYFCVQSTKLASRLTSPEAPNPWELDDHGF